MNEMQLIEPIPVTDSVLFASNVFENDYAAWSSTTAYAVSTTATPVRVILTTTHKVYESVKAQSTAAVTISNASPAVVTWAAHGLSDGTPIVFSVSSGGALPTGLTAGTTYYVKNPATDTFNVAASVGGAAIATTAAGSGTFTATAQSNYNRSPDQNLGTFWTEVGATNKWKMFDAQNNTQTTNTDSISVDLKAGRIATGVFVGNVDGDSVTVTVTDPTDGLVYSKTESMIQSNSGSSFWNWAFKRIVRKTSVSFTDLPPYANATINVTVTKTGGTAKCGMCSIGPVYSLGLPVMGVSTDIKDWSTVQFNADGTSSTVVRGYSKRMSVDLVVDNDVKDSIENQLASYRQTPVVWVLPKYESGLIYGKYSSAKTVIESYPRSRVSLQIEGMV